MPKLRKFIRKSLMSDMIAPFTVEPIEKKQARIVRRIKFNHEKKDKVLLEPIPSSPESVMNRKICV